MPERCVGGQLANGSVIAYSSGSSGTPTIWPRFAAEEVITLSFHDELLRTAGDIANRRTLLVVCFALGWHIAGVITVGALADLLKQKKYPATLVTPGKNLDDIVSVVQLLGGEFDQIVFFGHPGFMKQVVDRLTDTGHDWSAHTTLIVTSGGGFFESWRDYMLERIGEAKQWSRIISLYGATDIGPIAHETAASIALRRSYEGQSQPFLFQYVPTWRYIESIGEKLVFTVRGGAPLIRYELGDRGFTLPGEASSLPFVGLYGRPNTVVVNGANIYAEDIQRILEHPRLLPYATGRFIHRVGYSDAKDEVFEIAIEAPMGVEIPRDLGDWCQTHAISSLMEYNKEYADCVRSAGGAVHPRIIFLPCGHSLFQHSQSGKKKL